MLGFGGGSDNQQRLWNFLLLKMPVTDEELPIVAAVLAGIALLVGIAVGIYLLIKWMIG